MKNGPGVRRKHRVNFQRNAFQVPTVCFALFVACLRYACFLCVFSHHQRQKSRDTFQHKPIVFSCTAMLHPASFPLLCSFKEYCGLITIECSFFPADVADFAFEVCKAVCGSIEQAERKWKSLCSTAGNEYFVAILA